MGFFAQWQWEFEREQSGLVKQFDSLEHVAAVYRDTVDKWRGAETWRINRRAYLTDFREFMDTQVIVNPG
jgi:hypothetical protein